MAEAPLPARGPRRSPSRFGGHAALDDVSFALDGRAAPSCSAPTARARACCCARCTASSRPPRGVDAAGRRTARPHAQAMVFQRPVMLRRPALANVEYALAVNGVPSPSAATAPREALERVGLAHLANRPARVLSGGEQQRLALARAWALEPRDPVPRRADREPRPGRDRRGRAHRARDPRRRHRHRHDDAQPRPRAPRRRRDPLPARGAAHRARRAVDRFFTAPASPEAAPSSKESCHGTSLRARLLAPEHHLARRRLASPRSRSPAARRRPRSSSPSPRPPRPSSRASSRTCCPSSGRPPASRRASSPWAPARRSTWADAAMPTWCSCTTRSPRRNSSPKASA